MHAVGDLGAAGSQFRGLDPELADPFAALRFGECAGLEGVQVPLDGVVALADLGIDAVHLVAELLGEVSGPVAGGLDGFVEEVAVVVDVKEGVEDSCLEFVGGEAFGLAFVLAIALPGVAGVVAVPVAAAVGGGADEVLPARRAHDEPAEEVVGGVGAPPGVVAATAFQDPRGGIEGGRLGTDQLNADVFKVPHHASKRGLNFELVERIAPKLSLVSSRATTSGHGFPHDVTVNLLREAVNPVATTSNSYRPDWENGIHFTAAEQRAGNNTRQTLGSIAVVLSPTGRKRHLWRFGDNPDDPIAESALTQARCYEPPGN